MWPWRLMMPTQYLLRSSLLILRNMLTTVWCRFGSWSFSFEINFCSYVEDFEVEVSARLKIKFVQYFAADIWSKLSGWILVEILKLGLVKILKFKFCGEAVVWLRFWSWCLVEILRMKWSRFVFELMIWTQPSGPLCLWQCFATAALDLRLFCQKTIFEDMGSYSTHQNGCFPKGFKRLELGSQRNKM